MDTSIYRIMGIDPGTNTLGTALIDTSLITGRSEVSMAMTSVASSMASGYDEYPAVHGERAARLYAHEENLLELFHQFRPHWVIAEAPYMGRFAQSYGALVECGVYMRNALYRYDPTMRMDIVDPTTVKKSTGMTGRMVGKEPVRDALAELDYLHYASGIRLSSLDEHSVDAIAVAHYGLLQLRAWLQGFSLSLGLRPYTR